MRRAVSRMVLTAALLVTATATACSGASDDTPAGQGGWGRAATPTPTPTTAPSATAAPPPSPAADTAAQLPLGGRSIFPEYRVVAYYGTANNPRMGVLGESSPDGIMPRLREAAQGFASPGRKVQVAYELIVTVAQASPGADGDYSAPIRTESIKRYVDAARRHKVLVVLDIQPGRSDFLSQVKPLRPFLEQPHVGLALDPEWRMGPNEVPAKTIGRVSAAEINEVSAYLADIVREKQLPEKLFILHQFRASMIPDIERVERRPGLELVQHLDGFGTRSEKDATFKRLRRPEQFRIGYKLFYDEDINIYRPHEVLAFRPSPDYVSYQ